MFALHDGISRSHPINELHYLSPLPEKVHIRTVSGTIHLVLLNIYLNTDRSPDRTHCPNAPAATFVWFVLGYLIRPSVFVLSQATQHTIAHTQNMKFFISCIFVALALNVVQAWTPTTPRRTTSTTSLPMVASLGRGLKRVKESLTSQERSREDLKIGIAGFYDRSSKLWEDVWGTYARVVCVCAVHGVWPMTAGDSSCKAARTAA
jgi:hypothetical protein